VLASFNGIADILSAGIIVVAVQRRIRDAIPVAVALVVYRADAFIIAGCSFRDFPVQALPFVVALRFHAICELGARPIEIPTHTPAPIASTLFGIPIFHRAIGDTHIGFKVCRVLCISHVLCIIRVLESHFIFGSILGISTVQFPGIVTRVGNGIIGAIHTQVFIDLILDISLEISIVFPEVLIDLGLNLFGRGIVLDVFPCIEQVFHCHLRATFGSATHGHKGRKYQC
jgi:hypothetical protein